MRKARSHPQDSQAEPAKSLSLSPFILIRLLADWMGPLVLEGAIPLSGSTDGSVNCIQNNFGHNKILFSQIYGSTITQLH